MDAVMPENSLVCVLNVNVVKERERGAKVLGGMP
jgi:hypothetical protein